MISAIRMSMLCFKNTPEGHFIFVRQFRKQFLKEVIFELRYQEQTAVNQLKRDGKICFDEKL